MPRGGSRPNSGPKTKPKQVQTAADQIKETQDRAIELLPEIFDLMWQSAKGVKFLVSKNTRSKPTGADYVGEVEVVQEACPRCKKSGDVFEVYEERPDANLLKFLHEQAAGKAAQKAAEKVDPVIIVRFGDYDCETPDELKGGEGGKRLVPDDKPTQTDNPPELSDPFLPI